MRRYKEYQETGWKVKGERPEEIYKKPEVFYNEDEIKKYSLSGAMQRAQEKIAFRVIELLAIKKGKILDLGCGVGYTTLVYKENGFDVIGLDILEKMLKIAKEKGLKVKKGDIRELKSLFKEKEFDAVVSASAFQWLTDDNEIKEAAEGINYILKKNGKLIIQFYPRTENELMKAAHIFKEHGFEGQIIIDNPETKKRTIYLVLKKL